MKHLCIIAGFALCANAAHAYEDLWPGTVIELSGQSVFAPAYEGSDEGEFDPFVPGFYIEHSSGFFIGTDAGLGYRLGDDFGGVSISIAPDFGRKEADHADFSGLGNQDDGVQMLIDASIVFPLNPPASNLEFPTSGILTQFTIQQNFGSHEGLQAQLGVGYGRMLMNERLLVAAVAYGEYANGDAMQNQFGITAAQAGASAYSAYSPGGGFKSMGVNLSADYEVGDRWTLSANAGMKRLIGDAADSPLVRDDTSYDLGIGFTYTLSE